MNQPYAVITSDVDAQAICEYLAEFDLLALDTETYSNGKRGPELYYSKQKIGKKLWISDPWINNVRLIQIRSRESESFLFDVSKLGPMGLDCLRHLLNSDKPTWIGHNLKFDWRMLCVNLNVKLKKVFDTQLASQCIGFAIGDQASKSRGWGLKDIIRDYLGHKLDKTEQASNWGAEELTESQFQYASDDLLYLFQLYDLFTHVVSFEYGMLGGVKLEMEVMPVVAEMEINGIHLDVDMYNRVQEAAKAYLPELEEKICNFIGHPMISCPLPVRLKTGRKSMPKPLDFAKGNSPLDSNPYMLKKFRDKGIPVENLKADDLEDLFERFPILEDFCKYKDLAKQLSNDYIGWIHPVTGKIHAEFDQMGTATARFSCLNPNLQQVSKYDVEVPEAMVVAAIEKYRDKDDGKVKLNYRYCFIAPPGYKLASSDYSGQEIRVMVALSKDPAMLAIHHEPEMVEHEGKLVKNMGADIHAKTAELVWGLSHGVTCWTAKKMPFPGVPGKTFRDIAKTVTFGLAYGKTVIGLAKQLGISEEEAEAIIKAYFSPYPTLKAYLDGQGELGDKTRISIFGRLDTDVIRIRMLSSARHSDKGALNRAGKNTPIQGTSALMMKMALVKVRREIGDRPIFLIGCVHDEVLGVFPTELEETAVPLIKGAMEEAGDFFLQELLPCKAGVGVSEHWTKD